MSGSQRALRCRNCRSLGKEDRNTNGQTNRHLCLLFSGEVSINLLYNSFQWLDFKKILRVEIYKIYGVFICVMSLLLILFGQNTPISKSFTGWSTCLFVPEMSRSNTLMSQGSVFHC